MRTQAILTYGMLKRQALCGEKYLLVPPVVATLNAHGHLKILFRSCSFLSVPPVMATLNAIHY